MNNEIFNRLEGLMKCLMLSVEEGSYTRAEMKAYASGIELAAQKLEDVLNNLFADTAGVSGLAMFLSLIGEKPAASQEESRQMITNAISAQRHVLTKKEFEKALVSRGLSYSVTGNEIWLLVPSFNKKTIESIIEVGKDYIPSSSVMIVHGYGESFANWDSLGLRWFELDSLDLPFCIAEKL